MWHYVLTLCHTHHNRTVFLQGSCTVFITYVDKWPWRPCSDSSCSSGMGDKGGRKRGGFDEEDELIMTEPLSHNPKTANDESVTEFLKGSQCNKPWYWFINKAGLTYLWPEISTLMLLHGGLNLANTKWIKKNWKVTETLAHGYSSESDIPNKGYPMNTNMTGFRWF